MNQPRSVYDACEGSIDFVRLQRFQKKVPNTSASLVIAEQIAAAIARTGECINTAVRSTTFDGFHTIC